MTRNFRFFLFGCCILAGAALLAELALPFISTSSESIERARARDERLLAKKADTLAGEILTRPLFTDGRQPPTVAVAKAEPPQLQGRLAGVVLQADSREALFSRPGGRPITVKEGDVIDGWKVSKIEEDQVTLTSAFGEQVVKPTNGGPDEVAAPPARPAAKKSIPAKGITAHPPVPGQAPAPQPSRKADLQAIIRLAQVISDRAGS
jgi:hypothetical protein